MNGPFCNFCLQTGILCGKCQSLIDSGELTNVDITVAMELYKLEQRYNELKDVTFFRAVEVGSLIVVLVGERDLPVILGHRGKIIKELEQNLKERRVKALKGFSNLSSEGEIVSASKDF